MQQGTFKLTFNGEEVHGLYIRERGEAERIVTKLCEKEGVIFGFDVETYALPKFSNDPLAPLDPLRSLPRLLQVFEGRNVVVFDLLHIGDLEFIRPLLSSKTLIAHNAIFEIQHLLHNFKVYSFNVGCTLLATRLIYHAKLADDSGVRADLGSVVRNCLKVDLWKDISHNYWGEPELSFEQIQYAALDAVAVLRVAEKLEIGLKNLSMIPIYKLYKAAQYPIALMQLNGMCIDKEKHLNLIAKWKKDAWVARGELEELTGLKSFTANSIANYLEKKLPEETLALWPRTDSGKLSTDANAFSDFDYLDIVEPFSKFQKSTTLCSTFGTSLQEKLSPYDQRFHTNFRLGGARTGRLSSSKPNLQNAPRSKDFRSIFTASEGMSLVVADFNQIELRVAAELSGDIEMTRAYREGLDLHTVTAEGVSRKKLSDMSEEERAKARQNSKALSFGLAFGLGSRGFKKYAKKQYKVELTQTEAEASVDAWHRLYSGYTAYQRGQAEACKINLEVRTKTGKLRKLSEDNYYGASANTPVQGTASEIMLNALCFLSKALPKHSKLLNTVHDEIVVECPKGEEAAVSGLVDSCMVEGYEAVFPKGLTKGLVKVGSGPNWAEAK